MTIRTSRNKFFIFGIGLNKSKVIALPKVNFVKWDQNHSVFLAITQDMYRFLKSRIVIDFKESKNDIDFRWKNLKNLKKSRTFIDFRYLRLM